MTDKNPDECFPCESYRPVGCAKNLPRWPHAGVFCISYRRDPGADYQERLDRLEEEAGK